MLHVHVVVYGLYSSSSMFSRHNKHSAFMYNVIVYLGFNVSETYSLNYNMSPVRTV